MCTFDGIGEENENARYNYICCAASHNACIDMGLTRKQYRKA